jgi:GNAT superfamily N-acetyltransferase
LIRPLRAADSVAEITTLLHAAYAHLAEAGFRFLATHQDEATTRRRMERGWPYVLEREGAIVGTITLYPPHPESLVSWYRRTEVVTCAQFGVRPDLQRRGLGAAMMDFAEAHARRNGAAELALDTAEGALHLVDWYLRRGHRPVETVQWPVTNYRSVVLSKALVR